MSDNMSIDQKDPSQEENTPVDSKASSPDHEDSPAPPDAQPVKRKGGRKPVRRMPPQHPCHGPTFYFKHLIVDATSSKRLPLTTYRRSTQPRKRESRGTDRLRLPSGSEGLSISSNWRRP